MLAQATDTANIDRYGYLNYIEETEIEKNKNYTTLANSKLNELNRVSDELSLTMHGDYNLQKGVIGLIRVEQLDLNRRYIIKESEHTIAGPTEKVKISLNQFDGNFAG